MRRAATPLRCTNRADVDSISDMDDVVIPVMVSELTAPSQNLLNPQISLRESPESESTSPVFISVRLEENGNDPSSKEVVPSRERRKSDGNDTSWAKIKKKTSPVVNASVVFTYLVLSTMFVFGWVSLHSCTVNPLIPVYLIVAGSTGILTRALIRTRNKYLFNVVILLVLFDLCWQAYGSYIVYREYQPNYDPTFSDVYCHRVAYLLAFWIITIVYSLIGLFILLSSCYFLMRNTFRKA